MIEDETPTNEIAPDNVEIEPDVSNTIQDDVSESVETIAQEITETEDKIRIFLQKANVEELTTLLEKRNEILGDDEFRTRLATPGSYENILALAADEFSVEALRIQNSIGRIEDKKLFDGKLIRDGKTILGSFLTPKQAPSGGKAISGREAKVAFAIKTGRVRRIPLYNSGFSIDIEAATLSALNTFFTKAHDETTTYGKEFGASFFYFNDLIIKKSIVELVIPLITGSSLKNWNRGGTLLHHIKLNDLKAILNTLAFLMFPDGFNFTHVCTNPTGKCTHHEEILIDISKLVKHNYLKLSDENIEHMTKQEEVSHEKVTKYQEALGFKKSLRYGNIEFELKVPSLEDYLLYGEKFNAELTNATFTQNNNDVYQALLFSYYKVYTPFIESVTLYDENGNKDISSSDVDVISHQLGVLQSSDIDKTFISNMDDYIADTEITQICYPAVACPNCGHKHHEDYFTVDPEHTFFILSLIRLTPS